MTCYVYIIQLENGTQHKFKPKCDSNTSDHFVTLIASQHMLHSMLGILDTSFSYLAFNLES